MRTPHTNDSLLSQSQCRTSSQYIGDDDGDDDVIENCTSENQCFGVGACSLYYCNRPASAALKVSPGSTYVKQRVILQKSERDSRWTKSCCGMGRGSKRCLAGAGGRQQKCE